MIVSHKHKFIFIKTKKTAGTSMEISLSGVCGSEDMITPISPADEKIRQKNNFPGPQNHKLDGAFFFNHTPAIKIRDFLGEETWNSYFKFCFERNPWDKVISWYFWEKAHGNRLSFSDFIKSGDFSAVGHQGGISLYTDESGSVLVDKVYRFEEISEAMGDIAKRLGLDSLPNLPRAKSGFRKDKKHYSHHYSEAERVVVADAFSREIELFGYQFEESER